MSIFNHTGPGLKEIYGICLSWIFNFCKMGPGF